MTEAAVKQSEADLPHEPMQKASAAEPDLSVAPPPSYQEARQIPRISIHAFCISPETGAVLQRAADDRRVARAHVTVMMGGVEAGVAHYTDKPTPNLILVETRGDRQTVLNELAAPCRVLRSRHQGDRARRGQ